MATPPTAGAKQAKVPKTPQPSKTPATPPANVTPLGPTPPFPGAQLKYGAWWKPTMNALEIELWCFRLGKTKVPGSLGSPEHFWNVVDMLWGPTNRKKRFLRTPWADRMTEVACGELAKEKGYMAVAGAASTGKSEWAAVFAIVNWLASPSKTMVLVTSTSLKDARRRVWGAIRDYFQAMPGRPPGKLVDSAGLIRTDFGTKQTQSSDRAGIALIAAEKSKDKEAYAKLIGFKNDRVFLIADELPELGESVIGAAFSNLSANPKFFMCGLGNPNSYYDAFGILAKPKDGWASINLESEFWETERGVCLRLDGAKSPNIIAGKTIYPWLMTESFYEQQKETLGENSKAFYRMVRGFWSLTGAADGVYSEADIIKFKADSPVVWIRPPVLLAALDPAFTNGGDRSALYFAKYGESNEGLTTICFDHVEFLNEDMTDKATPRSFQIVKQFRERCEAFGVLPENACFDTTGAGRPFGDIVAREWSPKVVRIDFSGKASESPASVSDATPASERYANRVSEIWFGAKELMRCGQIRGVTTTLAKELCARLYSTEKSGSMRLRVEAKPDMKMRIGKSPDEADAALMLVALAKERFGFGANRERELGKVSGAIASFKHQFQKLARVNTFRSLRRV